MIKHYCDRCEKECNGPTVDLTLYDRGNSRRETEDSEICQQCYDSFLNWWKLGKAKTV